MNTTVETEYIGLARMTPPKLTKLELQNPVDFNPDTPLRSGRWRVGDQRTADSRFAPV
jgi:hypothetical protein